VSLPEDVEESGLVVSGGVVESGAGAVSGVVVAPGVAPASLAASLAAPLSIEEPVESLGVVVSLPVACPSLRWPHAAVISAAATQSGIQIFVLMSAPV
jgi:hypothetical protein